MKRFALTLFAVLLGISLHIRNGAADSWSERHISSSQYEAMVAAYPEVKKADDELEKLYTETREIIGEEGGGGVWLAEEQMIKEAVRKSLAFEQGEVGTPAFVHVYLDETRKRIEELHKIAAEGRVVERQVYTRSPSPDDDQEVWNLSIWKYEENRAKMDIAIFTDARSVQCTLHYSALHNTDGTWSAQIPDFSDANVDITLGAFNGSEEYDVHVTKNGAVDCLFYVAKDEKNIAPFDAADFRSMRIKISSDDGEHYTTIETENADAYQKKGIMPPTGLFRRINKVPRADDPSLQEVAACTLGKDHSQTVHVMRNKGWGGENVYYFKTSQGLFAFASFGTEKKVDQFEEMELSHSDNLLLSCDGDAKERVLVASGEFTGNSIQVRVIRYNSASKEWQILNTAERSEPKWIYLNDTDMKVVLPDPFDPAFTVYSIGKGEIRNEEQRTIPKKKGYRVFPAYTELP